jgi:protein-disulfide isomerase
MHDLLFAQPESTPFTPAALRILAASLALEMATFDACIATAADRIAADVAQANRLSLGATPAFMLGTVETNNTIGLSTRINGAQPLEVFREAIDELGRVPSTEPRKYSALTTSQSMPVR